jgi:SpoVK/Ycf46/Vps4 family AAA+-type ATPase
MIDLNAALGSLQGQSEQAFRDALEKAKKLAPVVIIADEIEKMISGVGEGEVAGNEVAMKLFGMLLTTMAEPNNIYWVASANKVSHLPPEFLRKGRFDNIWYVPFPNDETRAKIIGIHCRKNDIDTKKIDIESLVESTKNWTGAEIEYICKEAAVKSIANGKKVTTEDLKYEISHVKGISKNAQKVKDLETWAADNARSVD